MGSEHGACALLTVVSVSNPCASNQKHWRVCYSKPHPSLSHPIIRVSLVWLVFSSGGLFALVNMTSPIRWVAALVFVSCVASAQEEKLMTLLTTRDFNPIFNGTNLDGWIKRGGKATYVVENAVIVGTCSVKNGGNTFLCTEKEYGDFLLELEIKSDKGLNSGVQIRSHCFETETSYDFGSGRIKISANRVHGYQVEVDHRPERSWSGGIYEEARRGWLFPLVSNSPASKAFKLGEWNKFRVECRGASIKTWVNDVAAADLVDAEMLKGFIGLQVHSADKPEFQVRFRNIRIKSLGEREWNTAWDGRSFEGTEKFGAADWKLEDGVLHATHTKDESRSGSLAGGAGLSDFTLRFKYKRAKGDFGLAFLAPGNDAKNPAFNIQFTETMGVTNYAKLQDWNTVTVNVRKKRVVVNLNGHQANDSTIASLPSAVQPALTLDGGKDSEVFFKEFEILDGAQ